MATLELTAITVADGQKVSILDFRAFEPHQRAPREGCSLKTGKKFSFPQQQSQVSKPVKPLRGIVINAGSSLHSPI
ncbi:MAG: HU family DNA-binding protein [Synechococcus sp.]